MLRKSLILNSLAITALTLFFILSGTESMFLYPDSVFINNAEAGGKDKDKDKDSDSGYVFNQSSFTTSADCSNVKRLTIEYDKDFIATNNAPGPNVLVVGSDSNTCSITIDKISGGNKCGFKVGIQNKILGIETKVKAGANNCEMCIKVVAPRMVKIQGK